MCVVVCVFICFFSMAFLKGLLKVCLVVLPTLFELRSTYALIITCVSMLVTLTHSHFYG